MASDKINIKGIIIYTASSFLALAFAIEVIELIKIIVRFAVYLLA